MKKNIVALAIGSVVGIGLLTGGATYALFSSAAINANNTFTSGTVNIDMQRDLSDTVPGPMFYSASSDPTGQYPYDTNKNAPNQPPGGDAFGGWAPGDDVTRAMNIYNRGTLQAKLTKLKASVNAAGVTSGDAYNEFIQKMNVKVMYPGTNKVLYNGPLAGLLTGDYVSIPNVTLMPNPSNPSAASPANITFEAKLDPSADNLIQGKSFVFDFSFQAEQSRNNP
ncbi:TasA family protein [Aneurinibacillus sp. Ricciae_BoGa-3]|uniref:TasA family protein n=1 Tax=Aneurinibacillus sp. Ricciae_BoGa-3 TaxID=3022697 RepID=UPI0023402A9D|nr:TasA family protein [Aneurinibacillus sp. Ricciae_BoGa-3]WCK52412.1 TasA family protein [Aneurinibacillus sp. Ricciae_BoGa-3]